jgi:DNA repair protein RadC
MSRPREPRLRAAPGKASDPGLPGEADDKGGEAHYKGHRDRVRRRLLSAGPEAFADYELLELLLFYSIERVDVKPLAKALLKEFGSLGGVLAASREQLEKHDKLGERTVVHFKVIRETARRLLKESVADRPVVSSWNQLLDYCRIAMADEQTERFRILFLDRKNKIIRDEVQQTGTVDHTPVYPREVIKRALELGASSLILVHNHPSGDPTPSQADIAMTRELGEVGAKLGITLHDHVVIAKGGVRSFKATGLL